MSVGHSLASGFGRRAAGGSDETSSYEAPKVEKYTDNSATDAGEERWRLEFSRQKLYARGAPQHQAPMRPASAGQEAYAEPVEGRATWSSSSAFDQRPQQIAASCVDCQGVLACHGPDPTSAFCVACNQAALLPAERGIQSLIR